VLNQPATPLESVPDLEPGIIEKLVAAGITTVEAVADMTPEQLEEVPGIGPKTVEKISIAVNNYFSSLDAAAAAGGEELAMPEEVSVGGEELAPAEDEDATLDAAAAGDEEVPESGEETVAEDGDEQSATGPDSGGQSGDVEGLSAEPEAGPDSVEDLVESGQYYEAEVVEGVEDAPLADEAEVTTHERPAGENENVPDEEKPGEQR
jgi:N utilization substance protein A